ncbi:hypothetical protein PC129_g5389 [Phytophthora cactorum]|uniref:NADP-dependent oxidoreductase domain-containing protein n=1 Tax=Phytophthora cactorum TaxID=29920 RepID=A0A329SV04_9STRA|nr:hypothetical protein Pcac1_g8203 [Phytophthora cactorum]KAG2909715.1 hypothetical protein PC114_g10005 [Phytophthora cactorum]KAG2925062.1 hypothetical protein PC115_g8407 [Phytophthora cactorum]KAG2942456.1 hypothetical protein PC117_g9779 [Phytophthora cactorum]KAG2984867.1 hypothetical protein PC118_g8641 [Phytophthora cactorum]
MSLRKTNGVPARNSYSYISEQNTYPPPKAVSVDVPTKTLPSGASIPMIGLGVYQSEPGAETYNAVLTELKLGYRHIDTAEIYGNEEDVGRAALAAAKVSTERLGLGYIDLDLLHAPGSLDERADTWRAVVDLHDQGILKDIGVSNFSETLLAKLLKTARVKPAVNQVELHPWMMRSSLVKYCEDNGIIMEAYSPLARATKMDDSTLISIANEPGATPGQVLVAFGVNGFVTLPKSVHEERLKSNLELVKFKLSPEQAAKLASPDSYIRTAGWDPIKDQVEYVNRKEPGLINNSKTVRYQEMTLDASRNNGAYHLFDGIP